MSKQLLIYETAVPVSSGRHGRAAVEVGERYAFARALHAIPLMAVEFAPAAAEYAIVFAANEGGEGGGGVLPVVILGARAGQNAYLDADDRWRAGYVPAFVRRYPFVFSASDDGQGFTLCVDEAYPGLNYQGRGQALFDAQGQPSAYVDDVLRFLQEYRAQHARTEAFCRRLQALDLLQPMQAQFTLADGQSLSLTGFSVVDRARLQALPDATLAEMVRSGELELLHLHLHAMRNFDALKDRLGMVRAAEAQAQAVPA